MQIASVWDTSLLAGNKNKGGLCIAARRNFWRLFRKLLKCMVTHNYGVSSMWFLGLVSRKELSIEVTDQGGDWVVTR
jgi:hypothetical protein